MAANVAKMQILKLYKTMLRDADKFASYNFKSYTVRRIRDSFKANKTMTDHNEIQKELAYAQENLKIIRRQSAIGDMFRAEKLVIENRRERSSVNPSFETKKVLTDSEDIGTKSKPLARTEGMEEKV